MTAARARTLHVVIGALIGLLLGIALAHALRGDGHGATSARITQTRSVARFDGVELAGDAAATISVGRPQYVRVSAPADVAGRISTRVAGGVLRIDTTGSMDDDDNPRIEVRVASLHTLTLTGSGLIVVGGVHTDRLRVALDGSGLIRAEGTATRLDVGLDGSGDLQLDGLAARDVHATLNGSGRITVRASRSLDATLPGTGLISYGGDPDHVRTSVTGSGTIVRR